MLNYMSTLCVSILSRTTYRIAESQFHGSTKVTLPPPLSLPHISTSTPCHLQSFFVEPSTDPKTAIHQVLSLVASSPSTLKFSTFQRRNENRWDKNVFSPRRLTFSCMENSTIYSVVCVYRRVAVFFCCVYVWWWQIRISYRWLNSRLYS